MQARKEEKQRKAQQQLESRQSKSGAGEDDDDDEAAMDASLDQVVTHFASSKFHSTFQMPICTLSP